MSGVSDDPRLAGGGASSEPPSPVATGHAVAEGGQAAQSAARPPIVDVWSRTEPKYRIRAAALLALNFLLFCGLCAFTHWLHVGRALDFSPESYLTPLRFWGEDTQNLNDFVLYPISVQQTPLHAIVLGLLVASIVAVPIIIAILYRLVWALPFIAAVCIFAHLPWMSFTLLVSCILAAVPPFRMSSRFASALVGMLPVLLYLFLATRGTPEQMELLASPTQKSLLAAPWLLAIVAACVMMATVLLISRAVNYRPGAVAPVVAVMFATPIALFHLGVGVDELHYRVLEAEYGPRSPLFEPVRDATEEIRALMFEADPGLYTHYLQQVWGGRIEEVKSVIWQRLLVRYLADRAQAYEACKRFRSDHPTSRYAPCALYLEGRILDTRLDERKLGQNPPVRELYTEFPHVQSEVAWTALYRDYPDSPLSIVAGLRLAQLQLRRGEIEGAAECLTESLARGERLAASASAPSPAHLRLLASTAPESSLNVEPLPYLREARRLLELIAANRDDPRFGDVPLAALAALDPHRPRYGRQLLQLAHTYHGSRLYDNLLVYWAGSLGDPGERRTALAALLERFPDGDALPEAMFRLAEIELQGPGAGDEASRARGLSRLRELAARYGHTSWGELAAERLAMIEPRLAGAAVAP
jgi:hypothetical protein